MNLVKKANSLILSKIGYREAERMILKEGNNDFLIHIALALYRGTSGRVLKTIYLITEHSMVKDAILKHHNCPNEIKVAEEL